MSFGGVGRNLAGSLFYSFRIFVVVVVVVLFCFLILATKISNFLSLIITNEMLYLLALISTEFFSGLNHSNHQFLVTF